MKTTEVRHRSHAHRRRLCLTLLCLLTVGRAAAAFAEPVTFTLRDGSTIHGEVLSQSGGVYSVRSTTLGTVTIAASDVRSLSSGAAAPAQPAAPGPAEVEALKERMANDPATLRAISALQDIPAVQEILDDPELMRALQSGDLQALMGNPKLARLAADPRVQAITRELGSR